MDVMARWVHHDTRSSPPWTEPNLAEDLVPAALPLEPRGPRRFRAPSSALLVELNELAALEALLGVVLQERAEDPADDAHRHQERGDADEEAQHEERDAQHGSGTYSGPRLDLDEGAAG